MHQSAYEIAAKSLRACYQKNGIIAGPHHFTDYWARDSYFAAFGALAIGDFKIVKKQLKLFFSFQKASGIIPYRVMRGRISLAKYLGKPTFFRNPRPTYKLRGIGKEVLDGTTLSVLFASILKEDQYLQQIKKALVFLEKHERNHLLWDGPMAEWNDAVWKSGNLLYSNIIYWYMYKSLNDWQQHIDPIWSKHLINKQQSIAKNIRDRFWNGRFFADWYDYKRHDYMYPFGNCLAITWGLASAKESSSILKTCQELRTQFTLHTNTPTYPWWRVDLFQRIFGLADYQNHGILWWQPVTSYITALKTTDQDKVALSTIDNVCQKIIADKEIYECYEKDGSPVKRAFYQSERPFAWASGMIIWALNFKK